MDQSTTPFGPSAPLRDLIRLAIPICRCGELALPPCGPGRPIDFPEWAIAVMVLVALAKRLHSKSSQYRFLAANAPSLARRLGLDRFPARSTYFRRYRAVSLLMAMALPLHAAHAAARGHIAVRCTACDKTVIAAAGPPWHKAQQRRGERPKGVDDEASWTFSEHDGWVYGYGLEVVVTAPRAGELPWPLIASLDPAHIREAKTFPRKPAWLPKRTRYVLVDMGYDSNDLAEAVEGTEGRRTGRRLVGPQQSRGKDRHPPKRAWRESRRRRARREHRRRRRAFYESPFGRRLYRRRGRTAEPFHGRFKEVFELTEHVNHRGLENNRAHVLGCLLLYQILLVYNRIKKHRNGEVKWILDLL